MYRAFDKCGIIVVEKDSGIGWLLLRLMDASKKGKMLWTIDR